jgi:hypothetical protein
MEKLPTPHYPATPAVEDQDDDEFEDDWKNENVR